MSLPNPQKSIAQTCTYFPMVRPFGIAHGRQLTTGIWKKQICLPPADQPRQKIRPSQRQSLELFRLIFPTSWEDDHKNRVLSSQKIKSHL